MNPKLFAEIQRVVIAEFESTLCTLERFGHAIEGDLRNHHVQLFAALVTDDLMLIVAPHPSRSRTAAISAMRIIH